MTRSDQRHRKPRRRPGTRAALTSDPEQRLALLRERRQRKMARSAHAYVRGSTERFYQWLDEHRIALPEGPPVWICGDCHSGNLGPLGTSDGRTDVQIRDLDQTVIGNPAWDLLRLLLSLASAARGMDLAGVTTLRMIEAGCAGYALGLRQPGARVEPTPVLRPVVRIAARRAWSALARERLKGLRPSFPLGPDFWPLTEDEQAGIQALFQGEDGRERLATVLGLEPDAPAPVLLDAAYWVKGCSSLGLFRAALLVAVDGAARACRPGLDNRRLWRRIGDRWEQGDIRLLDLKQAVDTLAPDEAARQWRGSGAERVRTGALALSPNLGERMACGPIGGRSVFIRELMPQDLKLEFSQLSEAEAIELARALGRVVGQSHGRQLKPAERRRWANAVATARSKSLDAPTWIWTAVRDLMAVHEAAYLDHCRRYGQGQAMAAVR